MILAGVILAEAAVVYDGLNAVQTQSYGPEARGGASRSEVVIAKGEIEYPKVMVPDVLLCMSQEACDKFYSRVKEDGCIIVDSSNVSRVPSHRAIAVPISQIAEEPLLISHLLLSCSTGGLPRSGPCSAYKRPVTRKSPWTGSKMRNIRG